MALRTFHSNPSLGGFGSESSTLLLVRNGKPVKHDGDAFAQILKELVDNAVDACTCSNNNNSTHPRRVRVSIETFGDGEERQDSDELLLVTVTDNGIGMENIQSCVDPFHTSKGHAEDTGADTSTQQAKFSIENATAGRYGIGLTLCLLHAQRLVPGSCAAIRSSTADQEEWTTVTCIIDAEQDSVQCSPGRSTPKKFPTESGTSVSLLVPGGSCALVAWFRLSEYFARFKLSTTLRCSLEVLAPTLSRIPLFIRPVKAHEADNDDEGSRAGVRGKVDFHTHAVIEDVWKAASQYLGRAVPLENVAHARVPIRCTDKNDGPFMELSFVVQGPGNDGEQVDDLAVDVDDEDGSQFAGAPMVLIRMVNRIPLLDSSEAAACGLVQSLDARKRVWHAFGLDAVRQQKRGDKAKLLTFQVGDSQQVAPFFQQGNHALLRADDSEAENESSLNDSEDDNYRLGSRSHQKLQHLLPAQVRLGHVLVIVQIVAEPSDLPLPTLSKGRLPVDNKAIDDAMDIALTKCLQQLQTSNPKLLLTASQLRTAERDALYVPAVSSSLANILCNSRSDMTRQRGLVGDWDSSEECDNEDDMAGTIEHRLRLLFKQENRTKKKRNVTRKRARVITRVALSQNDDDTDSFGELSKHFRDPSKAEMSSSSSEDSFDDW